MNREREREREKRKAEHFISDRTKPDVLVNCLVNTSFDSVCMSVFVCPVQITLSVYETPPSTESEDIKTLGYFLPYSTVCTCR